MNLLSRFAKIADGVVMAASPLIRVAGLSLKAPTRTKLPANEFSVGEPSSLLDLKALLCSKTPGKLMITESADALSAKMHGRRNSKKRPKEERPSSGGIDEVLGRLC